MGFIPIFVALSGLILLYSIYTYNQIKPRKARINQVIEQMAANSSQRKGTVMSYHAKNSNSPMKEVAEAFKKTSTDRFQSYKKEEELINITSSAIESISDKQAKEELKKSNTVQRTLLKKLKLYANDYNRMISKAPAKFVASVFGFRSF